MKLQFERTVRLIGEDAQKRLNDASVAIFGIGGVGSFTAEALSRAGIGRLTFIDADEVDITNINRQLIALNSTAGIPKCEVMRQRALDINPDAEVTALQMFYDAATADSIDLTSFDYIVDAIDSVASKLLLIERAYAAGVPIISAMGAGNKLDPTKFVVSDIYKTKVCPLARVMRRELKKRGVEHLKVVYSEEEPIFPAGDPRLPASISFVPSVSGLIIAGEVIKDITGINK
ncbi:MAG: tRNA threonylcarbamoyladenosine dehydratase [Clostridia bacterium]|nr:tRNA threonylcarbamoyladenosine dehydratase [Clostridia bacterium]